MKPEFPIVQIDVHHWNLEIMIELFLFNEFYYSRDNKFYNDYFNEKRFLDSNGRIFLAKEKTKTKDFWSKIGIRKKYRITFEETGEKWSFDETKNFLVSKISELSLEEGRNEWIKSLEMAQTIKHLIEGMR